MGAKTKITPTSTLTPEQKALLDSQMRGVYNAMQGLNLGAGWGGPSFESYNPGAGYGGSKFDMTTGGAPLPTPAPSRPRPWSPAQAQSSQQNPMLAALQSVSRIPSAPGAIGSAGMVNPTSPTAYSNRENLVSPLVNPFRRNLGG